MAEYWHPDLGVVDAVQFVGRSPLAPEAFAFEADNDAAWVEEAMAEGTIEVADLGHSLTLKDRGGTVGMAKGDWLIRTRHGELRHCWGNSFEQEYRRG